MSHPLDRVVWSALTGPQADLAVTLDGARRFDPAYGMFAAAADRSAAGLTELVAQHGEVALVEAEAWPDVPGTVRLSDDLLVQMTADTITPAPPRAFEIVALGETDEVEMLALATLTRPGPFFDRTPRLGQFVGVKVEGRLAAMAGERMRADGFTEVSGVCTHPDHRAKGYAGALMRIVADAILARGETPFLHSYAHNSGAIALYRSLGFTPRREVTMTRLGPG